MGCKSWNKFKLLMWKNGIIQLRHKLQTMIEILMPLVFCLFLILLRIYVDPIKFNKPTIFQTVPINYPSKILMKAKQIPYAPTGKIIEQLMEKTLGYLKLPGAPEGTENLNIIGVPLTTGVELERYIMRNDPIAGILFETSLATAGSLPNYLNYTIRFPSELRTHPENPLIFNWITNFLFPVFNTPGPRAPIENAGGIPPGYYDEGFANIQNAIGRAFISLKNNSENIVSLLSNILVQRYPYPPYTQDILLSGLEMSLSMIILLSFMYPCINTVRFITAEKEHEMKEIMQIMGLQSWLHWCAWFTKSMVVMLISSLIIILLLKLSWTPGREVSVFTYSSWTTLLAFFVLYTTSTTTFCFMISVFFSKANTAASVAGFTWILLYMPYAVVMQNYSSTSLNIKLLICLLSNSAMGYNLKLILMHEGTGEGLQWHNIALPVTIDDDFTVRHVWSMLLVDTFLYLFVALYLEKIFPGEYGVPEPWYFMFLKRFWCGSNKQINDDSDNVSINIDNDSNIYLEPDPLFKHAGIRIKNLRKVYGNNKVAVHGLSLNMYEDQITVLLGHNGAGKTTTMSMLAGVFPPTSGTAIINGKDLRTDINGVRESLGICPQHNILFDELTVREHIIFFSKLKGVSESDIDGEIVKYVSLLDLQMKTNAQSATLSGGMKRKLSVAVAFCGRSRVVVCDEPTSGMDPSARRALWDILQQEKKGRTILLSTHFMDEADILGDRIAIMYGGILKCCGSAIYLKKMLGAGYYLICVKTDNCVTDIMTKFLSEYIPNINVKSDIGSELGYQLPEVHTNKLPSLLVALEDNQLNLGISSFGISLPTLEEVFLKVGSDMEEEDNASKSETVDSGVEYINENHDNDYHKGGCELYIHQIEAMLMKKIIFTYRNYVIFFIQNFIAVIFVIITIVVVRTFIGGVNLPALKISLYSYPNSVTVLEVDSTLPSDSDRYKIAKAYEELFDEMPSYMVLKKITNDMNKFFLKLSDRYIKTVNKEYIISAGIYAKKLIAYFNNQPYHSLPLTINTMHNAFLRATCGKDCRIDVTNHPIPYKDDSRMEIVKAGNNIGFHLAINIGFTLSFVAAFYVLFYIKERECRAKLLQFVSGANIYIYWITAYIWDLITFTMTAIVIVTTLYIFQEEGWREYDELGRLFILLISFGWTMLPLHYWGSMFFTVPSIGFTRMVIFNIFTGVTLFLFMYVASFELFKMESVANILREVGYFFPHFIVTYGLSNLNIMNNYIDICNKACIRFGIPECTSQFLCNNLNVTICCELNYFQWKSPGIGRNIITLLIMGIILFILLLLKEISIYKMMNCAKKIDSEFISEQKYVNDEDVENEKEKIINVPEMEIETYNLILRGMTKYYNRFRAVNNLYVGVKPSECFGLLGINGAGKTTTFKMLTGDETLSSGDAWIKGISIKSDMNLVYHEIGYCPQFDALIEDLTGREILRMFCLLRGLPRYEIKRLSLKLATELNFMEHIDKKVKQYSGGNKRKLSTAVALIGNPSVLYLDEPTTGMDPGSKRHLWNVICKVRNAGKTIILTTHYIDECEALCTRLAIMVNGEFKCIGSTQHLKSKFSQGLTLVIKAYKPSQKNMSALNFHADQELIVTKIKEFIELQFPNSILKEEFQSLVTYFVTDNVKWSKLFKIMETAKTMLPIEDYAISQTSLEQIFLFFAKYQKKKNIQ